MFLAPVFFVHFPAFDGLYPRRCFAKEEELHTLTRLNALIESRTCQPGEVIVHKGEKNRDLFFLTKGLVEISTMEQDGNIVLNQITAPNIFGEIGFLFGFSPS
jgi:CRP-like cAMP-binding protein